MDLLERNRDVSGGRAAGSGGFYHLSFRSGSRAGGASARSGFEYVTRSHRYDDPDLDAAVYIESGNMPSWAQDNPGTYWDAADLYERANGRLYVAADLALPRDLSEGDQIELARQFAQEITKDENLPYTLAIHSGDDRNGHEHNPHAHLMFSERQNDGIERAREQWFRRANRQHPERGGAPKSRTFHGRDWIERARERWAEATNRTLERCGRAERVDHRSYERQGIDRQPGVHYGPAAAHLVTRGHDHDRIEAAGDVIDAEPALRELDSNIARLEAVKEAIMRDGLPEEREPERRDYSHSQGGGVRGDGQSWER
jgi:hypothetical protein